MMFVPWRLPGQCLTHRLLPAPLLQQVRQGMEHNWNRWSTAAVPLLHDSGCTSSHPQRPWHLGSSKDPSCPLCGLLMATEGRRHLETHLLLQSHQEVCSQKNDVNSNPVWAQTEQQQRDGKMLQGIKTQPVALCCHKQQCRSCLVHPCIRKQVPNSLK